MACCRRQYVPESSLLLRSFLEAAVRLYSSLIRYASGGGGGSDSSSTRWNRRPCATKCCGKPNKKMLTIGPLLISTITWLHGNHKQAAACLQERLVKLVQANPWLTGKIVRRHWYSTNSCLAYDATKADQAAQGLFRHVTIQEASSLGIAMDASTPLDEVADVCRKHDWLVRPGHNQAVYALTVVAVASQDYTASNDTTFAVIASMSHIVGDGHTFYALYNYLVGATNESTDDNVPTLQVTRVAAASRNDVRQCPLLRPLHTHALGFLIPATIGLVVGKLRAVFSRQYRVERRYLYFDMAAIERLKQQHVIKANEKDDANENDIDFVSTNDVITSWALRNARCRHGFMVANWRNRVDGYTDRLAGNYFTLLYHDLATQNQKAAMMTPSTIRRSILQCTAAPTSGTATRSPPSVPPAPSRFWVGGPFIVSSSLASFGSKTITLPAGDNTCCRQVLHARITSCTELDMHPAHFVYALVFCANSTNGQLGMMLCGSPSRLDGLTSENCPLAKPDVS